MLKPPAALMPGIAGGASAKTRASGMRENSALIFLRIAFAVSSGLSRCFHG